MAAVVSGTGLIAKLGESPMGALPIAPGTDAANVLLLTPLAILLGPLVTNPAVPSVLSPPASEISEIMALLLKPVLMTQVTGFSKVFLPYQVSPIIVSITLGGVGLRAGTKLLVALTLVTLIILLVLQYLSWQTLGRFG